MRQRQGYDVLNLLSSSLQSRFDHRLPIKWVINAAHVKPMNAEQCSPQSIAAEDMTYKYISESVRVKLLPWEQDEH